MSRSYLRHDPLERAAQEMAVLLNEVTGECFPDHEWAVCYDGYSYSIQMVGTGDKSDKSLSETVVVNIGGQNHHVKKIYADSENSSTEISPEAYHSLRHAFASLGILSTEERRSPLTKHLARFLITAFKSHYPNFRLGVRISSNISDMTRDIQWLNENKGGLRRSVFSHTRGFAYHRRKITSPIARRIGNSRYRWWKTRNLVRSVVIKRWKSAFSDPK